MTKWNKVGKQNNPVGKDENKTGRWKKNDLKNMKKIKEENNSIVLCDFHSFLQNVKCF